MKKCILVILSICLSISESICQDYLPFVVEGKIWNLENRKRKDYWPEKDYDDTATQMTCELREDVEINGRVYKKYYQNGQHIGNLREEGKRVYRYINNHDVLLYDFGMQEGDAIENYGLEYVLAHRDEFESCGNTLHRMEVVSQEHFGYDYPKSVANYWIEGIGALEGPLAPFYADMVGGTETTLVSCYIGNKCIYRKEDYPDEVVLPSAKNHTISQATLYDLQGRQLQQKPSRGMYIQGGHIYKQQ